MAGYIAALIIVLVITAVAAKMLLRVKRRKLLRRKPFPDHWRFILEEKVALYRRLPEHLKLELGGLIHVFLDEKTFIGCRDQEITELIKLTIAAQACILILNRSTKLYPRLNTIYVYPQSYIVDIKRHDGDLVVEGRDVRMGESWHNGPVVLAWDSITQTPCSVHQGHNVVLHEFAHQLDQEDGAMNGAPLLDNASAYKNWADVFQREYETLCDAVQYHQYTILDDYGTANPAEFFAVATEAFFEKPSLLHQYNPDLYEELQKYYKLDPACWESELV